MSAKICEKCGESNAAGALLCISCGSSLKDVPVENIKSSAEETSNIEMPQYHYNSTSNNGCAIVLLFIATFLIPIVGLVVGGIFAFSDDDDKQSIGTALLGFGLFMIVISIVIGAMLL